MLYELYLKAKYYFIVAKTPSKRCSLVSIGNSGHVVVCTNLINASQFEVFNQNLERYELDSQLSKADEMNFNVIEMKQLSSPNGKDYLVIATSTCMIIASELPWLHEEIIVLDDIEEIIVLDDVSSIFQ